MPRDYAGEPHDRVRRADRAVTDEAWIAEFLHRAPVGTLATVHEGRPFVNSNLFVFDAADHAIYIHTARYGRTRSNAELGGQATFTAFEMGRLLPADTALEFSVEYASVVAYGEIAVVDRDDDAKRFLQRLLDKYAPHLVVGQDYREPVPEEIVRTSVFRLAIESWTAKRKAVAADFPGAYLYDDVIARGSSPA
jgi:nitroimidazol reductase NimA-like FMN-containing flavoprotein (pyridoxamine 5'-phosphate oxidase superfamily)